MFVNTDRADGGEVLPGPGRDLPTSLSSWSTRWLGKLLLRAAPPSLRLVKEVKDTHRGTGTFQTARLRPDPARCRQAWPQQRRLGSLPVPDSVSKRRGCPNLLPSGLPPFPARSEVPPNLLLPGTLAWQLTPPERSPRAPAEQHRTAPERAPRREEFLARALPCQELQLIQ